MEDLLIEILSNKFKYPIFRQGSLSEDTPYPDHFFTFWNRGGDGDSFYDNDEHSTNYEYDLNFYSIDPDKTYEVLKQVKQELKSNGFQCFGVGSDIASDEITHTGRTIDVWYKEQI